MKIIAVASNYASHNNNNTDTLLTKTEPLLYSKADSSVIKDGKPFFETSARKTSILVLSKEL